MGGGTDSIVKDEALQLEEFEGRSNKMRQRGLEYADDLNNPFLCYICLELVHKPVVNACGHMFCFLCVHRAMNALTESYCPLCRNPYMHIPRVCEQLDFFLLKATPEAYQRRCKEVAGEWKNLFRDIDDDLIYDEAVEEAATSQAILSPALDSSTSASEGEIMNDDAEVSRVGPEDESTVTGDILDTSNYSSSSSSSSRKSEAACMESHRGFINPGDHEMASSSSHITESDVLCMSCKKLLYRPVVVNCGHVFCEGCLAPDKDAAEPILKCYQCGSINPGGFPSVCLELHQYLEQNFHAEYNARKKELAVRSIELQKTRDILNKAGSETSEVPMKLRKLLSQGRRMLHSRIGCDGCGMYPMLGRRFQCVDCPTPPGYDLCGHCYETGTNLVGRFNQRHTNEHRMQEVMHNEPWSVASSFEAPALLNAGGGGTENVETHGIVEYIAYQL